MKLKINQDVFKSLRHKDRLTKSFQLKRYSFVLPYLVGSSICAVNNRSVTPIRVSTTTTGFRVGEFFRTRRLHQYKLRRTKRLRKSS